MLNEADDQWGDIEILEEEATKLRERLRNT
jgi:hypothetical protein